MFSIHKTLQLWKSFTLKSALIPVIHVSSSLSYYNSVYQKHLVRFTL